MGTAAALFGAAKDAFVHQILNIAQGGSCGSLGHLCPFAGVEFALKAIPKPVDDFDLPFIQCNIAVSLPKQRFLYRPLGFLNSGVDGIFHGLQEPHQPSGDVQSVFAHVLQQIIVVVSVAQNGRRHAVETPR